MVFSISRWPHIVRHSSPAIIKVPSYLKATICKDSKIYNKQNISQFVRPCCANKFTGVVVPSNGKNVRYIQKLKNKSSFIKQTECLF